MQSSLNSSPSQTLFEPQSFTNYEDISNECSKSDNTDIFLDKYRQSLQFLEKTNTDHTKIAICCNNIASVLVHQSKYSEADKLYKQALKEYFQANPNTNDLNTAFIYQNLGWMNFEQGNLTESFRYTKQSLDIRLKFLDLVHPDIALSYNNLSVIGQSMGRIYEALDLANKALEIRKVLYPDGLNPFMAESYLNLGAILQDFGRFKQALECANEASRIYKKLYGESFRDLATIENNKGSLNSQMGSYVESLRCYMKAIKIYEGANSRTYTLASIINNLVHMLERNKYSRESRKGLAAKSYQLNVQFIESDSWKLRNARRRLYQLDEETDKFSRERDISEGL